MGLSWANQTKKPAVQMARLDAFVIVGWATSRQPGAAFGSPLDVDPQAAMHSQKAMGTAK
jgi:hypothetical protein